MALTYTEIEEQKNARIYIFFGVVILFYFVVAAVLGSIFKLFLFGEAITTGRMDPFLSPRL